MNSQLKAEGILLNLKLKCFIFLSFFAVNSYAINVLVAKEAIPYNTKLTIKHLTMKNVPKVRKSCTPVTLKKLEKQAYMSKHYINKGFILCEKSLKTFKNQSILFDFGSIQIEKSGKLINETDDYIIIKKLNGKTEKIYKDGRLR